MRRWTLNPQVRRSGSNPSVRTGIRISADHPFSCTRVAASHSPFQFGLLRSPTRPTRASNRAPSGLTEKM